ncbi:hypothetical protein KCU78_g12377, partial [Aureobasidium melanogenum]
MPPSGAHRDRLVVGLDFGTTFSGCAFAYSGSLESPDEIEVIRNWPGSNNITSEKVPTELTYEPASTGAGVKRTAAGEPSLFNDPRHAKTRLERRFPLMVATTQIDIVITVTAVWSDAAKDVTMKAAEKAGMGENLFMVSEPDAAAIYAMKSIDVQQNFAWQVTTSSSVTHGVAQLIWPQSRFADEDPPPAYTSSSSESATAVEEGPRYIIMQPESSWTHQRRGIGRARKRPCGQQKGETSLRSGLQRIMGSLDPFTQEQVRRPYHERAQSEKPDVMVHRAGARHAK